MSGSPQIIFWSRLILLKLEDKFHHRFYHQILIFVHQRLILVTEKKVPTEGGCGMQTFFPANKAFLDIYISSKNMLFLESRFCAVSIMITSMANFIMLMGD